MILPTLTNSCRATPDKSCVMEFDVPSWMCLTLGKLDATPSSKCADGVLATKRASTTFSGFQVWRPLASLSGLGCPDKKSPPPTSKHPVLEANPDRTPDPSPVIRCTKHKSDGLVNELKEVLAKNTLRPGSAGENIETIGIRHHQSIWKDSPSSTSLVHQKCSKIIIVTGPTPSSVPRYNGGCVPFLPFQVAVPLHVWMG